MGALATTATVGLLRDRKSHTTHAPVDVSVTPLASDLVVRQYLTSSPLLLATIGEALALMIF
jgi:hypothetical protein